jgi:hypothetical protein
MAIFQRQSVSSVRNDDGRSYGNTGRSVGPRALELASALLVRNSDRALSVLVRASNEGWELREVEQKIIAPAVTRVCQMWMRGRVDEITFNQAGSLAESVERSYRDVLLRKTLAPARHYLSHVASR